MQPLPVEKTRFFCRDNLAAYISIGKFSFISSFWSGIISCKAIYWIKTRKPLSIVSIHCSNREISSIFNLINAHSMQMLQVRRVSSFHLSNISKRNRLATIKRFNSFFEKQQETFFVAFQRRNWSVWLLPNDSVLKCSTNES